MQHCTKCLGPQKRRRMLQIDVARLPLTDAWKCCSEAAGDLNQMLGAKKLVGSSTWSAISSIIGVQCQFRLALTRRECKGHLPPCLPPALTSPTWHGVPPPFTGSWRFVVSGSEVNPAVHFPGENHLPKTLDKLTWRDSFPWKIVVGRSDPFLEHTVAGSKIRRSPLDMENIRIS